MLRRQTICASFLLLILSLTTAVAQNKVAKTNKTSAVTITASASGERVRFTAPSSVVQIRLEIYNSLGKKQSDNELRGGNVIDWLWQNGQSSPLADDTYVCVITVKSLSGRITQRIASVKVERGTASLQAAASSQMTAQQTEAIGPVEENTSVTVLSEDETPSSTVLAHTGTEGQLIRGQGALSFRLGDFFSGKDKEQMRLTEDGNLGVGTATPQARLDVAGMIRTQGLILPDGSILTSAASIGGSLDSAIDLKGSIANLGKKKKGQIHTEAFGPINGDGTPNTIPKFTGANTIGNSVLSEVNGKVGIGTSNPGGQLHIFGAATADVFAGMGPDVINGPAFNYGYAGSSFGRGAGFFNVRPDASAVSPNPSLRFATANIERMIINNVGNIGIGTTSPLSKLTVFQANNYGITQTDGTVTVGTFINSAGGWLGTKSNHPLNFFTNNGQPQITLTTSGNVGIGTGSPAHRLSLIGGPTWTANSWTGALELGNASAIGWQANADGQHFGIGQSNGGLFFFHTFSGPGTTGFPANYDMIIGDNGNISQPPNANGMVKAMLLVNNDGTINLCYNSQLTGTAASTAPCGFSVNHAGVGTYDISFPFQVNTRFYSATIADTTLRNGFFVDGASVRPFAPQGVRVITYDDAGLLNNHFYLLVF